MLHHEGREISHNARLKKYPDGYFELLVSDRAIWRDEGWERADSALAARHICTEVREKKTAPQSADNSVRARRRAKAKVKDYALCTPFTHFCTFTLDKQKIDRYDPEPVLKKLQNWLDNQVRRHSMTYLLIPELHKDGALHFHALISSDLTLIDSKRTDKNGHKVFNLPAWTLGFSTAIELYGDRARAVSYVCKYITKSDKKIGGRWYYSGGDLQAPEVFLLDKDFASEDDGSYFFGVPDAGLCFRLYKGFGDFESA